MAMPVPPTALFAADPFIASGLVNEAHRIGIKIPSELSIVGFDDAEMRSLLYPKLTAVCQDSVHLGRAAVEYLERALSAGGSIDVARFQAWFEINATTSPPPAKQFRVLSDGQRLPALDDLQ